MFEKVSGDIIAAMKAKDKVRLETLRYVKKLLIENKTAKSPRAELDIVVGYAKSLRDAAETMPPSSELHAKTLEEIAVLQEYLPQALSDADVMALINEIKTKGISEFGAVMKELSPQIKGRFDGKRASELVKSTFA